jgi:glycogen operon protein
LFLAVGVPLMLGGDEVGNSQGGNNNTYCQDSEIGWITWAHAPEDDMTGLVAHLSQLRQRFPQLKPHRWLEGKRADGSYDVKWLTPAGTEMTEADWNFPEGRFLAYVLAGAGNQHQPLYIAINGADIAVDITFPEWPDAKRWRWLLDTASGKANDEAPAPGATWSAPERTVLVFAGEP